jgi:recombinational DNA repair ATPase RecF
MYVRHLRVNDFRSWESADVAFEPGASVLVGSNGQGKTNLIEALGYVATLSSHRVPSDAPLVRTGCERATVGTAIIADGRELRVELEITPGRANKARLNGTPVPRPREVLGALRLGSYELLRAEFPRGAEPILVLDDVFTELDVSRREQLAIVAGKAEQAIITAAVISDVPEELGGARYDVHEGVVRRVR